jgi:hypothetical protein
MALLRSLACGETDTGWLYRVRAEVEVAMAATSRYRSTGPDSGCFQCGTGQLLFYSANFVAMTGLIGAPTDNCCACALSDQRPTSC